MTADDDRVVLSLLGFLDDHAVRSTATQHRVDLAVVIRGPLANRLEQLLGAFALGLLVRHLPGHPGERADVALPDLEGVQRGDVGLRERLHGVLECVFGLF